MKQKAGTKKPKIEGRIEAEALRNPCAAMELAQAGRLRTPLEKAVSHYLWLKEAPAFDDAFLKENRRARTPAEIYGFFDPSGTERNAALEQSKQRLFKLILDAIDRHDGGPLRNLANEVATFKWQPTFMEPLRLHILDVKIMLKARGKRMTTRELADAIGYTNPDLSTLQRIAKAVNFPLAKDKVGRPRKQPSNRRK